MTDLNKGIFSELKSKNSIDIFRRNIQKLYVDKMIDLLTPGTANVRSVPVGVTYGFNTRRVNLAQTDLQSITRGQLINLKSDLKMSVSKMTDKLSKYHILDLISRINMALDPNRKVASDKNK
jgi:hypothetical protein